VGGHARPPSRSGRQRPHTSRVFCLRGTFAHGRPACGANRLVHND
jgi:hypothetical protein